MGEETMRMARPNLNPLKPESPRLASAPFDQTDPSNA